MGTVSVSRQGRKRWVSGSKGKGKKHGLKQVKTLQKAIVSKYPKKVIHFLGEWNYLFIKKRLDCCFYKLVPFLEFLMKCIA